MDAKVLQLTSEANAKLQQSNGVPLLLFPLPGLILRVLQQSIHLAAGMILRLHFTSLSCAVMFAVEKPNRKQ